MKKAISFSLFAFIVLFYGCNNSTPLNKGFEVQQETESSTMEGVSDSLALSFRNSEVLLTGHTNIRLATSFLWNTHPKTGERFTGSNAYQHHYHEEGQNNGNNWNYHILPGFEVVYGFNMVNVQHHDLFKNQAKSFFDSPVLIKNFYYPTFKKDTLNSKHIVRDYFLVTCYDIDTNNDGAINLKDLRKLYHFDLAAQTKSSLLPEHYSVYKSQYDSGNDYLFLFAHQDDNKNGSIETSESSQTFYINLKQPQFAKRMF